MTDRRGVETSPDPTEWLTVQQGARLTGQSARTWRWRAQREATEAQRCGRQPLARKTPPPDGKGRAIWHVHRSLDDRLSRYPNRPTRDHRGREALSSAHPAHIVERALKRNHWLQRWRKACQMCSEPGATDRRLAERIVAEARRVEGPGFSISVRSLTRWWRCYNRVGEDGQIRAVGGLIDRYTTTDGGNDKGTTRSPEAVGYFYDLYHTQNRLSVKICHETTLREARRHGWRWPRGYTATLSWLRKHDDLSLSCLMREGRTVWARRYLPHLEIDYTRIQPGEMYVADHTLADFWVSYKATQIRPWLTAIQDLRTRCIVGWHLGPAPHQDAVLAAARMAFREWAIPGVMRIDNGKDFTSKPITGFSKRQRDRLRRVYGGQWQRIVRRGEHLLECTDNRWLGITGELGIELIYAIPYSPWSKGTLERWFRTFHERCGKTFATYCGNAPRNKPECVDQIRADKDSVPTLKEARTRVGEYLDVYHRTAHRGLGGDAPLSVWNTATRLRRAVADELSFLMDVRGLYKVTANGCRVTIGSAAIGYGARCPALKRLVGRKVLLAVDPEDVSHCWAFTPDRARRQLIARLEPNEWIEPHTCADDAREAIAAVKREQAVMHKARRANARRTRTATQRINEHSRAHRAELLATGTDAAAPPRIVPVRTGFEGTSKPDRSRLEDSPYCPPSSREAAELFADEEGNALSASHPHEPELLEVFNEEEVTGEACAAISLEDVL